MGTVIIIVDRVNTMLLVGYTVDFSLYIVTVFFFLNDNIACKLYSRGLYHRICQLVIMSLGLGGGINLNYTECVLSEGRGLLRHSLSVHYTANTSHSKAHDNQLTCGLY